jgi:hypothetical protein
VRDRERRAARSASMAGANDKPGFEFVGCG